MKSYKSIIVAAFMLIAAVQMNTAQNIGTISQAVNTTAPYQTAYFGIYPQEFYNRILTAMNAFPPVPPTLPFKIVNEDNKEWNGGDMPNKQPKNYATIFNVTPIKWRILLDDAEGILMLSDQNLDLQAYDTVTVSPPWNGQWATSTLRAWFTNEFLNGQSDNSIPSVYTGAIATSNPGNNDLIGTLNGGEIATANVTAVTPASGSNAQAPYFTNPEKGAIVLSSLTNPTMGGNNDNVDTQDYIYLIGSDFVEQAYTTPMDRLSINTRYVTSYPATTDAEDDWITRTHSTFPIAGFITGFKRSDGTKSTVATNTHSAIRPSLRLDRDKILMVSQSKPGVSTTPAAASFAPSQTLKLTIVDPSTSFSATSSVAPNAQGYVSVAAGGSLTINSITGGYSGANTYVSVILETSAGIQYYTKAAASGTASVTLNFTGVASDAYKLKIFGEKVDASAEKPDYATAPVIYDLYIQGGGSTAPIIDTSETLSDGYVGRAYSDTIKLSNTPSPSEKYAISSGSLPPGLSLNDQNGRITGTPTTAGTYTFNVKVSNPVGDDDKPFTLNVYTIVPPVIATDQTAFAAASADECYLTIPYSFQFQLVAGTGLPHVKFSISSGEAALTAMGLTLDDDGTLHGTPTTVGTVNFTVCADTEGAVDYESFTISCLTTSATPSLPVFVTTTLGSSDPVVENQFFVDTIIQITGSAYIDVSYDPTTFPTGMTFDPSTRKISGKPAIGTAGTYNLKLWAKNPATKPTDPLGPDSVGIFYSLTVQVADVPVITTPATLPAGADGFYYSEIIEATGPVSGGPITLSIVGSPPLGMSFNNPTVDDSIKGTPSAGTYTITIKATNSWGSSTKAFTLVVAAPSPPPVIDPTSTASLPGGTVGQTYVGATLVAYNSPTSWSWTGAPPGLSLSNTGIISGTPTAPGTYNVTITATNPWGTSTPETATITIVPSPLTVPPLLVKHYPEAVQYQEYSNEVSPGYTRPDVEWSIEPENGLPKGLHLAEDGTGVIVGTPQVGGIFHFTVVAKSKTGQFADVRQEVEFIVADESDVTIARFVRITGIPGATLIIGDRTLSSGQSAEYTINSGDNFVFIYAPTGTGMKGKPVITTNRTDIEDETIGMEIKQNTVDPRDPDAVSYLVTIYDIRSNISINAVPSSLQPVDDGSIRGGIGKAYITTPTDYTARIYNIAGQTVTTLKAKAGENVVTLPAGVYLVESHNGAVAKIIVQ